MQWLGKAVGAALGFAVAGPIGLLLGGLVGHQFDQGVEQRFTGGGAAPARTQQIFFEVTFEVMGHLAKVDGRVTEEEIRIARRIMHSMKLTPEQVRLAIEHFTTGKGAGYPLETRLHDLKSKIGGRRDLMRAFVEVQLQAAVGGGEIAQPKRRLLWEIANNFGIGRVQFAQIEALIRAQMSQPGSGATKLDLQSAYNVLGVEAAASDKEVKTAYRRLMNQHHPDKLVSKGLPESMVTIAEQKTHEILAAYERIKGERGFK
jgi:DnaJ like chaperone protein